MIIFDLDGTLADCEHRRHFVDPKKNCNYSQVYLENEQTKNWKGSYRPGFCDFSDMPMGDLKWIHNQTREPFKPDWQAFYEACDKDEPIEPVIEIFQSLIFENHIRLGNQIEIWSSRCESVREKTQKWLDINVWGAPSVKLKMRPIGDSTPDDQLKEQWLDELIQERIGAGLASGKQFDLTEAKSPITMVFDHRPKVIRMWKRRGIFIFNCCQHNEEF